MRRIIAFVCAITFSAGLLCGTALGDNATFPAGNALVIAIQDHASLALPSADKDAGLIAAALARKNFNVIGARNLDLIHFKAAIAEFESRIKAFPSLPVYVYFSGPALQVGQDNYLLASNSSILDLKNTALSLNSLNSELARVSSALKWIVVDGARLPQPVSLPADLSTGLALPDAAANTIIMFNATPGLTTIEPAGSVNSFAISWCEAIGDGAATSQDLTDHVILRSFEMSKGKHVPWATGKHEKAEAVFTPVNNTALNLNPLHSKIISELSPAHGFAATLLRHSIANYEEYILVHIQSPMTQIVRALLASLREAHIWHEAAVKPTPNSLWAYLNLYPRGPHSAEARSALVQLGQTPTPPQDAALLAIATSPPNADEISLLARTIPNHLDETILDLQNASTSIRPLLAGTSDQEQFMPTTRSSVSYFDLPLPQIDDAAMARIQLPAQLPAPPSPPVQPDPKIVKKPAKPSIPMPPQRETDSQTPDETPLITITIPLFGVTSPSAPPAANEAPSPQSTSTPKPDAAKPVLKKPAADVFERTFDTAPAQQALPY